MALVLHTVQEISPAAFDRDVNGYLENGYHIEKIETQYSQHAGLTIHIAYLTKEATK